MAFRSSIWTPPAPRTRMAGGPGTVSRKSTSGSVESGVWNVTRAPFFRGSPAALRTVMPPVFDPSTLSW